MNGDLVGIVYAGGVVITFLILASTGQPAFKRLGAVFWPITLVVFLIGRVGAQPSRQDRTQSVFARGPMPIYRMNYIDHAYGDACEAAIVGHRFRSHGTRADGVEVISFSDASHTGVAGVRIQANEVLGDALMVVWVAPSEPGSLEEDVLRTFEG